MFEHHLVKKTILTGPKLRQAWSGTPSCLTTEALALPVARAGPACLGCARERSESETISIQDPGGFVSLINK